MKNCTVVVFVVFLMFGACRLTQAQVFSPPQISSSQNASNSTTIVNQSQPQNKQALGTDVPFFDPSSNNMMVDGKMLT